MTTQQKAKIQHRRDTVANWVQSNPVLRDGELCIDTTNNALKVGAGLRWNSTPYLRDEAYLGFDARGGGEEFTFILPSDCVTRRLDTLHGQGSWSISHDGKPFVAVGTLFDQGVLFKGHYVVRNEALNRNNLQLTVVPTQLAVPGKFQHQLLPVHADPEGEPQLTTTLAALITQANTFAPGDLVALNGSAYVLATGTLPVVGVIQAANAQVFRIAYEGYVLGLSGLIAGESYYRQPDGTLGTAENGNRLLLALNAEAGLFTRAAGAGGGAGIRPYETGMWQAGEVAISGPALWQAQQPIANSQSAPTQNNAWWTKVAEWSAPGHGHTITDIAGLSQSLADKADLVNGKVPVSQLPAMGETIETGTAYQ
jgi:hypothetical protein